MSLVEPHEESFQDRGEKYEREHVHTVYEQIASHFSSTRYKVFYLTLDKHIDMV
jgi:tRNA (uracil-5-)-methyltransferase TRM9